MKKIISLFGIWCLGFGICAVLSAAPHPADISPQDYKITIDEVTAYGACWKSAPTIPSGCPSGANLNDAVRAGTLWGASVDGSYHYDSTLTCPLCFASGSSSDTTPPTVIFTSPSGTITGTVTFTAYASDMSGIDRVEFYFDDTSFMGSATTGVNNYYSISFNTNQMINGSHRFTCKGFDRSGNMASSFIAATVSGSLNHSSELQWARQLKGYSAAQIFPQGLACDRSNNVVVVGYFNNGIDFGSGNNPSAGQFDIFMAKYSQQNVLVWSKTIGERLDDAANAVAIDSQGNIFVTGYFSNYNPVDFGGIGLATHTLTANSSKDIFLAKYSPTGSLMWVKQFGGIGAGAGTSLVVDKLDEVIMAANFQQTINFGIDPSLTATSLNMALVKFSNATGSTVWARKFGTSAYETPYSIAADDTQNIWVTGSVSGPSDLGGGSAVGTAGIFIAKYSGAGQHLWSTAPGGTAGYGIAIDATTQNVYVTGAFATTVNFGSVTLANPGLFIAAYDSTNRNLWALARGTSGDGGRSIAVDGVNLAAAGSTSGSLYVECFSLNGNSNPSTKWSKGAASTAGSGIRFDSSGHLLTTGNFMFSTTLDGTSLTATGTRDGFVAQYLK